MYQNLPTIFTQKTLERSFRYVTSLINRLTLRFSRLRTFFSTMASARVTMSCFSAGLAEPSWGILTELAAGQRTGITGTAAGTEGQ